MKQLWWLARPVVTDSFDPHSSVSTASSCLHLETFNRQGPCSDRIRIRNKLICVDTRLGIISSPFLFLIHMEMFYLTTHSTHFIYGYMASDIWLRTILIVRKETRQIGYSFRLAARVLLYAPSHIQDSTYHRLCYTSRGALAGTRNRSMGPPHEGSIRQPIALWANALTTELHLAPNTFEPKMKIVWLSYIPESRRYIINIWTD